MLTILGLKKKKKKLYDYNSVEVGQDIDNMFVLDCVDSVSQSIYRGHNLSYITITFIVYLCH